VFMKFRGRQAKAKQGIRIVAHSKAGKPENRKPYDFVFDGRQLAYRIRKGPSILSEYELVQKNVDSRMEGSGREKARAKDVANGRKVAATLELSWRKNEQRQFLQQEWEKVRLSFESSPEECARAASMDAEFFGRKIGGHSHDFGVLFRGSSEESAFRLGTGLGKNAEAFLRGLGRENRALFLSGLGQNLEAFQNGLRSIGVQESKVREITRKES